MFNAHDEPVTCGVPPQWGQGWQVALDTAPAGPPGWPTLSGGARVEVAPRSMLVLHQAS